MTYPATPDRHTIRDSAWWDRALCLGADPEMFFPTSEVRNGFETPDVTAAKAVCLHCPVVDPCLQDAIDLDDDGIRGGLTRDERRAIAWRRPSRAELTPIDHGTARGYRQHRIRRDEPCPACATARDAELVRANRERLARQHGTEAGYATHVRLGEEPCRPCMDAKNAAMERNRERRKVSA